MQGFFSVVSCLILRVGAFDSAIREQGFVTLTGTSMAIAAYATPTALPICQFGTRTSTSTLTYSSQQVSVPGPRSLALQKSLLEVRSARIQVANRRTISVRAGASNGRDANDAHVQENGYVPQSDFYKIEAIVRPWRLSHVASALIRMGIRGVTVYDVRGFGAQGGARERYAGSEFTEDSFVQKVKLEIVVSQDQVEAVLDTVIDHARTGEIGDGKIFISPVADVVRVRTGERGLKAERMVGGRAEILGISEMTF